MNRKLIAAAVSAAVVAPVASQADVSVYGRINNAIDLNDLAADGDSQTDVSGVASRFGVKYSGDIGNGMTAHGRYEFGTTTDKEKANDEGAGGVEDIRIATAGLSGAFGRIDIGNQWSAYFNTFGTLVSPTYTLGYYIYSSIGGGAYRTSNTIKYSNSFGPLSAQLDIRFNDDASPEGGGTAEKLRGDGYGLGLSFAATDNITIAAAYDRDDRPESEILRSAVFAADTTADDGVLATVTETTEAGNLDETRVGVAVKATFGSFWASAGWQNIELNDTRDITISGTINAEDDETAGSAVAGTTINYPGADVDSMFIYGGGSLGEKTSWLVGYSEADDGIRARGEGGSLEVFDDSNQVTWGIYHNIGGGLKLYYEAMSVDSERNGDDGDRHLLGMRVDF